MKSLFTLLLFIMPISGSSDEIPQWLIGTWKSNERLTLKDIERFPDVTEKARKIFNNNFFGRLVHVYRKNESTSYYFDEKPEKLEFEPYEQVTVNGKSVTLTGYDKILMMDMSSTLYLEDECFYILTSKWNFKEYFCPYDKYSHNK